MIEYKTLIPLQELDLQIDAAQEQIEEKKQKIQRTHAEIDVDAQLIEKKLALLKKIQLRKRTAETDHNEFGTMITTAETKMNSTNVAPNVYRALEKELVVLREKHSTVESAILADMEKIEVLEKDTSKGQKVIAGRREHLEQIKLRVDQEVYAIKKEMDLLKTQRSQISLKIAGDLLEKYEELRRKKRGKVLFAVESPSCLACGMGLQTGFVSSIVNSEEADYCSNCGALVYWTGSRE